MSTPWAEGAPSSGGPDGTGRPGTAGSRAAKDAGPDPGGFAAFLRRCLSPRSLDRFRLLITVATLAAIAWYLHARPRPDWSSFQLRWDKLALAAACLPPLLALRAAKWRAILRSKAPGVTLGESLRSYLGPMALALITPGRVGELARGLYLPHKAVQGWKGAGLVLLDSWTDFLAVLAWAVLGWAVVSGSPGLVLGSLLFAIAAPVSLWLRLVPPAISRFPSRWGLRDWAARCLPGPRDVPPWGLTAAFLAGLLAYGLEWLQLILLLQGLVPVEAEAWRVAGVMALVALAGTVQVTLAGLGVREGVSMMLLATIGIAAEPAVVAAFLQSVLILFVPALAGLAFRPSVRDPAPAS